MKNNRFIILAVALILSSCADKIIDLVVKFNNSYEYFVDGNGAFTEYYTMTAAEVLDDFDTDISGVESVNLSFLRLDINERAGNQAELINLSGYFQENETDSPIPVFLNQVINLNEFTAGPIILTGYQAAGIEAIADKLKNYINTTEFSDFTVSVVGNAIDVNGNELEQDINLDLYIAIDAEVVFQEEVTLPDI